MVVAVSLGKPLPIIRLELTLSAVYPVMLSCSVAFTPARNIVISCTIPRGCNVIMY
jgi:hypothetical protein